MGINHSSGDTFTIATNSTDVGADIGLSINSDGKVGIGTASVGSGSHKLYVAGSAILSGDLHFEGATDDSFETTLTVVDPTADRTITFQNGSGTVAFLTDVTGGSTPGNFTTITLDNNIVFEGDTDDANETTLTVEDPTADSCLLYTSPSPRDLSTSRMPSSA